MWRRLLGCLLAFSLLSACAGANWRKRSRSPNHRLPELVHVYVVISQRVDAADDGGSVAALVDALDDALRERGHRVVVVGARNDEKPPLPRVELQVVTADWGSRSMRGAGNALAYVAAPAVVVAMAGSGSMLVDCYVVQADSKVTFSGRVSAGTFGTDVDGYDTAGAERAGRSIASAIDND